MPPEVTAQAVHERSLADCEAYYNALGTLSAAQERRREVERELRANCAAQGCGVPAANDSTIAEIRSGQWERRTKLSMQTLLHNRARLARLKREGFTFDREHRLVAPALTRIHVPERRENRERRPAPRRRVASSASSEDPLPEPDPPLRVVPPAEFPAACACLGVGVNVVGILRRLVAAASLALFELDERLGGLESRRACFCLDCGIDTAECGDYYMLRDPVWLEANPDDEGMLCFDCLEKRLGRRLNQGDFALVALNFDSPHIFNRWARLEP